MSKLKSFKYVLLLTLFLGGLWYFFIKDYNYKVTFKIHQVPSIVYSHLIKWNHSELPNNKVVTILEQVPFNEVKQNLTIGDSTLNIRWQLKKIDDSTTLVTAKIKDMEHSFIQNLQVPFSKNIFVKQSISAVKNFSETLLENKKNYKLSAITQEKTPANFCAYITLQSSTEEKASAMVKNIPNIMNYIKDNDIKLTGSPFVEITNWDIEKDSITFNFCFPIERKNTYPDTQEVLFKETKQKDALKITFNGNYKISDMAWYQIIDYAHNNNIAIEKLPLEFFLNDPHGGGDPLKWVAHVYLPIKEYVN